MGDELLEHTHRIFASFSSELLLSVMLLLYLFGHDFGKVGMRGVSRFLRAFTGSHSGSYMGLS
jgi:hypothetical protein